MKEEKILYQVYDVTDKRYVGKAYANKGQAKAMITQIAGNPDDYNPNNERIKRYINRLEVHVFKAVERIPATTFHKKFNKFATPLMKLADRLKDGNGKNL